MRQSRFPGGRSLNFADSPGGRSLNFAAPFATTSFSMLGDGFDAITVRRTGMLVKSSQKGVSHNTGRFARDIILFLLLGPSNTRTIR